MFLPHHHLIGHSRLPPALLDAELGRAPVLMAELLDLLDGDAGKSHVGGLALAVFVDLGKTALVHVAKSVVAVGVAVSGLDDGLRGGGDL